MQSLVICNCRGFLSHLVLLGLNSLLFLFSLLLVSKRLGSSSRHETAHVPTFSNLVSTLPLFDFSITEEYAWRLQLVGIITRTRAGRRNSLEWAWRWERIPDR